MLRTSIWAIVTSLLLSSLTGAQTTRPAALSNPPTTNPAVADLRFDGVGLGDAIEFLRDLSGVNIHVNWRALESLNIGPQTSVTLRARGITIWKALELVLKSAGSEGQIAFYLDQGVIEITTMELADAQVFTRVYDVQDLVMDIPQFQGPRSGLGLSGGSGGRGGGSSDRSGTGSGGLFAGRGNQTAPAARTPEARGQDLVTLIRTTIRPEVWRENGGPASLTYLQGKLIITAPRSVHQMIGL